MTTFSELTQVQSNSVRRSLKSECYLERDQTGKPCCYWLFKIESELLKINDQSSQKRLGNGATTTIKSLKNPDCRNRFSTKSSLNSSLFFFCALFFACFDWTRALALRRLLALDTGRHAASVSGRRRREQRRPAAKRQAHQHSSSAGTQSSTARTTRPFHSITSSSSSTDRSPIAAVLLIQSC